MARFRVIHEDPALFPRAEASTSIPPAISAPVTSIPPDATATGILTDSSIAPSSISTNTAITPSSSLSSQTSATATTSPTSTSTAAPDTSQPLGIKLAEIIAPIAFIVILIPILYMLWVRHKTRNMNKLESEPRHSPSPSKELKFRSSSPRRSLKPSFLPPLFHEREPTKGPSLFEEVRVSMESARQKESTSLFDRPRDDLGTKESSYGVYALRRSLEDKGRADSIGLFDLPRSSARSSPAQPAQPAQRVPSPTLPSPKAPLFERPPSEAWPLPAAKLPEPPALYDPYLNPVKARAVQPSPSASLPPNMPLPTPPGSRQENQIFSTPPASRQENQTYSFASSDLLPSHPPSQQFRPSSSGGLSASHRSAMGSGIHPQYLSGSTAVTSDHDHLAPSNQHLNLGPLESPSSIYNTPATATFSPLNPGESRGRHRDSDLVSELSYRSPSIEREQKRQSVDAVSIVSAISHRRRRSERDVDTLSMVSALSPETDETPRIPIEHYPLT